MGIPEVIGKVTVIPAYDKRAVRPEKDGFTRVAAYCRVSTEEDNQKNSYSAQISYYTHYISANPDWRLVGIFADEGISGTRTKNRTQFMEMIKLARKKGIDLILCKSISRFARNTVDCLDYVRELKSLGITVIFEKENINTSTVSSEFAISLYASFAQAESESISKNVVWGIEKSFREGNVRYQLDRTLGYRMSADGKPYIIEDEARIVQRIFGMYAEGHSAADIAEHLTNTGAVRRSGSTVWSRHNVYQILKNEKYVGDALLQKTYTVNCLTHERVKNSGQKPMYFIQNCHEGIIDRKTYDVVRVELEKNKRRRENSGSTCGIYKTRYGLTHCLICPYCGATYKRTTWMLKEGKTGVWRCKSRLDGKKCERSCSYRETDLHRTILRTINSMIGRPELAAESSARLRERIGSELSTISDEIRLAADELQRISDRRNEILASINGIILEEATLELNELNIAEADAVDRLDELKHRRDQLNKNLFSADSADRLFCGTENIYEFSETLLPRFISRIDALNKNEIRILFANGVDIMADVV